LRVGARARAEPKKIVNWRMVSITDYERVTLEGDKLLLRAALLCPAV
jgi:hypothetical protein